MFNYNFALWLVVFTIMASLLGVLMYMLICLTDLENDFINPHDSAKRINKFVVPEYVAQALLTVIMIGSGHWLFTLVNLGVAAYHVHKVFVRKDFLVDVTEIFNQLPVQKKERLIKLGAYLVCFVYIIYRLVEAAVRGLMSSPATAAVTKKLLQNAKQSLNDGLDHGDVMSLHY